MPPCHSKVSNGEEGNRSRLGVVNVYRKDHASSETPKLMLKTEVDIFVRREVRKIRGCKSWK